MDMSSLVSAVYGKDADHKTQLEELLNLLANVMPAPVAGDFSVDNVIKLTEAVVTQETGSMVVSRQWVGHLVAGMDKAQLDASRERVLCERLIGVLQARAISYEEQTASLRLRLAGLLEASGDKAEAARALAAIPLESAQRGYSAPQKMELYLRQAALWLDSGSADEAESLVNRASMLQAEAKHEGLNLQHKALYARVLDSRRKFIDAAQRYMELSLSPSGALSDGDRIDALTRAITCTILAPPGVQRSRLLAQMVKDERALRLAQFALLEKTYMDRLVRPGELSEFESTLEPHQQKDDDGRSILRETMVEHNLSAAARIYNNISIATLAELLGVKEEQAERTAAAMISTGRVGGSIDQLERFVHFKARSPLSEWDWQLHSLCQQVNKISEMITAKHPQLSV